MRTPKPEIFPGLFARIRQVCEERGWSEREWSEGAGLDPTHLSTLKRRLASTGTTGGELVTWVKLTTYAGVSLDWLIFGPFEHASRAKKKEENPRRDLEEKCEQLYQRISDLEEQLTSALQVPADGRNRRQF